MANGEIERLSSDQVAALCEVLKCKPGDLFAEE
jgi:DNA-binding Xre family transcriptional regulator